MRLGTAIERLFDNYVYASDKEWIRDKVAWALYQTWKEADDRNCSEKQNDCKYAVNPSGDVWECGCCLEIYCEHQIYDRNPDGTLNIVECGFEPKTEPQMDEEQVCQEHKCTFYRLQEGGCTKNTGDCPFGTEP